MLFVKKNLSPHGQNKQSIGNKNMGIKTHTHVKDVTKSLYLPAHIKKHLLLHEEDKKRHACEKCGQCFDYPSQLERTQ